MSLLLIVGMFLLLVGIMLGPLVDDNALQGPQFLISAVIAATGIVLMIGGVV